MNTRCRFLGSAGAAALGAVLVSKAAQGAMPEAPMQDKPATQPPLAPPDGRPYNPVVMLNGWTLPWCMKNRTKEFHLFAEPVVREIAPGTRAYAWGGAAPVALRAESPARPPQAAVLRARKPASHSH